LASADGVSGWREIYNWKLQQSDGSPASRLPVDGFPHERIWFDLKWIEQVFGVRPVTPPA
jgi:hypothetical protein